MLLGVCGGRNSEGEDYPGDYMNAVMIAGLPYHFLSAQVKAKIIYYDKVFNNQGWNFAYLYPAMQRANQASGRPIRKERDKGAIIFMDERFDIMSFLLSGKGVSGINYLVFREDMRSIDGRVFHTFGGYLLAVNFLSHALDLRARLTRVGLNSDSLVDLYKIVCEDDKPLTKAMTITESAENFIWEEKLEKFAVDKLFRFSDGSELTIPLICCRFSL
ncbi:MAG: hypothetical protein KGD74_07035 [Candidatus Lokiarchaeota archaeon]|nr:hypothetical protein [Candidatus Lokiarchaeota archaeon]